MRVLVLHSRYLTGAASGENRVVEDEVRVLREAGHEVVTWEPSVDPRSSRLELAFDVVWSRSAVREVGRLLHEHRPEVVHVHSVYPRLSPAILRAVPRRVPIVMTLHNFRLMCLPATYVRAGEICEDCAGRLPWRGVVHACYRGSRSASAALGASIVVHRMLRTFPRVHTFLAVSHFLRDKHIEAGMDPSLIQVKSNFAWPTERRRGPGQHLLFLGRVEPEKGLATILEAVPPTLQLVVAGDGDERKRLELRARPGTTFLGQVDGARALQLLRDARALVVPSRWYEGQPRAIVEAFAAGVPVFASNIGGLPELVEDDVNGCLVDKDEGWTDALQRLTADQHAQRLGAGAYTTWQRRFTPEVALRELEDIYQAAVASVELR